MRIRPLLAAIALGCSYSTPNDEIEAVAYRLDGRQYLDGETLLYRMTGVDDETRYELNGRAVVTRNEDGDFVEEWQWSDFVIGGQPVFLTPGSAAFRQTVSLDPDVIPALPDLGAVQPNLIGPIADLLTFYADLWLVYQRGGLSEAGDGFYQEAGTPASWADGAINILGQSSIDFDVKLVELNRRTATGVLLIRHVPPVRQQVTLPVEWMQVDVADTPNNWVNVKRSGDAYVAAVGKETFDVRIEVDLQDGSIRSGSIDNVVETIERHCNDSSLMRCGERRPRTIRRVIEITAIQDVAPR